MTGYTTYALSQEHSSQLARRAELSRMSPKSNGPEVREKIRGMLSLRMLARRLAA